jgi:hypothetical protein
MNEPVWIRGYRLFFGALAIYAAIFKYFRDDDSFGNWFSKFTVQVNTYAGLILLGGALLGAGFLATKRWESLRGAAVVYLVITFFVYGFLIREFDNPFTTTRHWTHTVLHQVMPVAIVIDLFLRPFLDRIDWRKALVWTIYPAIYFAYSLVRGPMVDWYPYDFINPNEVGGYDGVAFESVRILAGFIGVSLLVIALSRLRLNLHLHVPRGSHA